MPRSRSPASLLELFAKTTVADLPTIQQALGGVSEMTAFRHLRQVPYRRSYNHNGRYYSLYEASRFDRLGLWSVGGVRFSVDGSLKHTVRRLVHEASAGATHRELVDWLDVRVHNTLLGLVREGEVDREQVEAVYVYLHTERAVRDEQLAQRRELLVSRGATGKGGQVEVDDTVVIQVLLTLIRHPGSRPGDIVRRLRGHAPPITSPQVHAVFTRYDLGSKGGPSRR